MAQYTRRVQTVLTEAQYLELIRLAEEREEPLSVLVREAVETVYLEPAGLARRQAALDRLLALKAPVSSWEEMEEEIVRGAQE